MWSPTKRLGIQFRSCLSVWQTITFESHNVWSSYFYAISMQCACCVLGLIGNIVCQYSAWNYVSIKCTILVVCRWVHWSSPSVVVVVLCGVIKHVCNVHVGTACGCGAVSNENAKPTNRTSCLPFIMVHFSHGVPCCGGRLRTVIIVIPCGFKPEHLEAIHQIRNSVPAVFVSAIWLGYNAELRLYFLIRQHHLTLMIS